MQTILTTLNVYFGSETPSGGIYKSYLQELATDWVSSLRGIRLREWQGTASIKVTILHTPQSCSVRFSQKKNYIFLSMVGVGYSGIFLF